MKKLLAAGIIGLLTVSFASRLLPLRNRLTQM